MNVARYTRRLGILVAALAGAGVHAGFAEAERGRIASPAHSAGRHPSPVPAGRPLVHALPAGTSAPT
jgi:hypothetical protein